MEIEGIAGIVIQVWTRFRCERAPLRPLTVNRGPLSLSFNTAATFLFINAATFGGSSRFSRLSLLRHLVGGRDEFFDPTHGLLFILQLRAVTTRLHDKLARFVYAA